MADRLSEIAAREAAPQFDQLAEIRAAMERLTPDAPELWVRWVSFLLGEVAELAAENAILERALGLNEEVAA